MERRKKRNRKPMNFEHLKNGFVHFLDSVLQDNHNNLIRVDSLLVKIDDILPNSLQSVIKHSPILIVHTNTNGNLKITMGLHLAK